VHTRVGLGVCMRATGRRVSVALASCNRVIDTSANKVCKVRLGTYEGGTGCVHVCDWVEGVSYISQL
jgi:hypothetical protein